MPPETNNVAGNLSRPLRGIPQAAAFDVGYLYLYLNYEVSRLRLYLNYDVGCLPLYLNYNTGCLRLYFN